MWEFYRLPLLSGCTPVAYPGDLGFDSWPEGFRFQFLVSEIVPETDHDRPFCIVYNSSFIIILPSDAAQLRTKNINERYFLCISCTSGKHVGVVAVSIHAFQISKQDVPSALSSEKEPLVPVG